MSLLLRKLTECLFSYPHDCTLPFPTSSPCLSHMRLGESLPSESLQEEILNSIPVVGAEMMSNNTTYEEIDTSADECD